MEIVTYIVAFVCEKAHDEISKKILEADFMIQGIKNCYKKVQIV